MSISSDEGFDSMAFLQDLDQDQVFERNDTGKKLNVSASNRLEEGVIVPAALGTLFSIPGSNSDSEEFFKQLVLCAIHLVGVETSTRSQSMRKGIKGLKVRHR
ncbi:uncharacterized protein LOC120169042 [Hibiscus syriacus]|nr:uncharacterized protein LOC120169042 [Hibiscus syriacus]